MTVQVARNMLLSTLGPTCGKSGEESERGPATSRTRVLMAMRWSDWSRSRSESWTRELFYDLSGDGDAKLSLAVRYLTVAETDRSGAVIRQLRDFKISSIRASFLPKGSCRRASSDWNAVLRAHPGSADS